MNLGFKLFLNHTSWPVSCGFQQKSHWRPLKSSTWWGGPWGWCGPALVMIWAVIGEGWCGPALVMLWAVIGECEVRRWAVCHGRGLSSGLGPVIVYIFYDQIIAFRHTPEMLQTECWGPLFTTIGTLSWMRTKPRAHKPVWFLSTLFHHNLSTSSTILQKLNKTVTKLKNHVSTEFLM